MNNVIIDGLDGEVCFFLKINREDFGNEFYNKMCFDWIKLCVIKFKGF